MVHPMPCHLAPLRTVFFSVRAPVLQFLTCSFYPWVQTSVAKSNTLCTRGQIKRICYVLDDVLSHPRLYLAGGWPNCCLDWRTWLVVGWIPGASPKCIWDTDTCTHHCSSFLYVTQLDSRFFQIHLTISADIF